MSMTSSFIALSSSSSSSWTRTTNSVHTAEKEVHEESQHTTTKKKTGNSNGRVSLNKSTSTTTTPKDNPFKQYSDKVFPFQQSSLSKQATPEPSKEKLDDLETSSHAQPPPPTTTTTTTTTLRQLSIQISPPSQEATTASSTTLNDSRGDPLLYSSSASSLTTNTLPYTPDMSLEQFTAQVGPDLMIELLRIILRMKLPQTVLRKVLCLLQQQYRTLHHQTTIHNSYNILTSTPKPKQRRPRQIHKLPNHERTIRGLRNYGQTCFLNAVLQCLASLEPFLDYLEQVADLHTKSPLSSLLLSSSSPPTDPMSWYLSELLQFINGELDATHHGSPPDPRQILYLAACQNQQFQSRHHHHQHNNDDGGGRVTIDPSIGKEQQDAQELLQTFLDTILDESQRPFTFGSLSPVLFQSVESRSQKPAKRNEMQFSSCSSLDSMTNNNSSNSYGEASSGSGGKSHGNAIVTDNNINSNPSSSVSSSSSMDEKKQEDFEICKEKETDSLHGTATTASLSTSLASSVMGDSSGSSQQQHTTAFGSQFDFDHHLNNKNDFPESPLHGFIGSTLQCCKCGHVRTIQNSPFLDIPIVPTSLYEVASCTQRLPSSSSSTQPRPLSSLPSCPVQQCLRDFCAVERVKDVECLACTKQTFKKQLEEEQVVLRGSLDTTKKRQHDAAASAAAVAEQHDNAGLMKELELVERLLCQFDDLDMEKLLQKRASLSEKDFHNDPDDERLWSLLKNLQVERGDANKYMILTRLPTVLCLHVQRRYYDHNSNRMAKTIQHVEFPEVLDVNPYFAFRSSAVPSWVGTSTLSPASAARSCNSSSGGNSAPMYRLQSVLEHDGDAYAGHYVAYRRKDSFGGWVRVSDETVKQVSWQEVRQCQAYMLFYQKDNKFQ